MIVAPDYLWGPLQRFGGSLAGATIGSRLAGAVRRLLPGRLGERLYKLRPTFARSVLMIGRKNGTA